MVQIGEMGIEISIADKIKNFVALKIENFCWSTELSFCDLEKIEDFSPATIFTYRKILSKFSIFHSHKTEGFVGITNQS